MEQRPLNPIWRLLNSGADPGSIDYALISAIVILKVTTFNNLSYEQVYDLLMSRQAYVFNGIPTPLSVQLNRMERTMSSVSTNVQKLQDEAQSLADTQAKLLAAFNQMLQAQQDAETRLENDIAALRNTGGNGDPAAIDAVISSLESTRQAFASVTDQLTSVAQAQATIDVPVVTTLTISPSTVTTLRTSTVSFSASMTGSTFSAQF